VGVLSSDITNLKNDLKCCYAKLALEYLEKSKNTLCIKEPYNKMRILLFAIEDSCEDSLVTLEALNNIKASICNCKC